MVQTPGEINLDAVEEGSASITIQKGSASVGSDIPFVLSGNATFAPRYLPDTFRRTKSRNLDRKENFCGGENVSDRGSENWEFHVSGPVLTIGVQFFDRIVEGGGDLLLTSLSWSGEVKVEEAELEGPMSWDPAAQQFLWRYTLDLVSTGKDESGNENQTGIIDEGTERSGTGGGGAQVQ